MYKTEISLVIVVSIAVLTAGSDPSLFLKCPNSILDVVYPVQRCGGTATQLQLRITDCDGHCVLVPGTLYDCENDFMPSVAAPSLDLRIELCPRTGFCLRIIDTELANSAVTPGLVYTAKYSFYPNDVLAGDSIEFRAYIIHRGEGGEFDHVHVCVNADIDIAGSQRTQFIY